MKIHSEFLELLETEKHCAVNWRTFTMYLLRMHKKGGNEKRNVKFQSEIFFFYFWFRCVTLIYTVIYKYMPYLEWPRTSVMKEARMGCYVQIIVMDSLKARGTTMSVSLRVVKLSLFLVLSSVIKTYGRGSCGKTPYIVDF
jgi:hypothetical protein